MFQLCLIRYGEFRTPDKSPSETVLTARLVPVEHSVGPEAAEALLASCRSIDSPPWSEYDTDKFGSSARKSEFILILFISKNKLIALRRHFENVHFFKRPL